MIGQFFASRGPKLQVVVNRYASQVQLLDDKQIEKALTRSIDWKIPDDFATARRTQNSATPLAMEDSSISRAIRRMARKACGLPEESDKGARSGLFGWARGAMKRPRPGREEREDQDDRPPSIISVPRLGHDHAKS
jgi:pilus assembly protein CpaE